MKLHELIKGSCVICEAQCKVKIRGCLLKNQGKKVLLNYLEYKAFPFFPYSLSFALS